MIKGMVVSVDSNAKPTLKGVMDTRIGWRTYSLNWTGPARTSGDYPRLVPIEHIDANALGITDIRILLVNDQEILINDIT